MTSIFLMFFFTFECHDSLENVTIHDMFFVRWELTAHVFVLYQVYCYKSQVHLRSRRVFVLVFILYLVFIVPAFFKVMLCCVRHGGVLVYTRQPLKSLSRGQRKMCGPGAWSSTCRQYYWLYRTRELPGSPVYHHTWYILSAFSSFSSTNLLPSCL